MANKLPAYANLGVIVALAVAFAGWLALGRTAIRRQETAPAPGRRAYRRQRLPAPAPSG